MSSRLDPDEALAGPLYSVAGLLVVIPLVDLVLSVPPPELSNAEWRFSAVGLSSSYTLLPILGLALGFVIAAVLKHYSVQRWLVAATLSLGAILLALSIGFLLDMSELRFSVPRDGRAAFQTAWIRAIIKLALSIMVLVYMGWRARRMIPARIRHRPTKTVHVVSK